ncbi:AraC family transcriptional regulator [Sporanaerobium hydrogeniformans]|uniref:AraC family transcriptional regulator n=1 Tax=Sporanaerobium hydrogeniformans TaxID=3072179 RepID=A0AC61DA14_9FIRM|nr:AraC family transcriptional regulator [Sporanaerobium hydrogeniformans]PHV69538.1 AraC family transcriptional regulator [Sporanaerobium hydrogeniformans]
MKKDLYTEFDTRQYMKSSDFEIFYYNDATLQHVSPHTHDYYEIYFFIEGDITYKIEQKTYNLQFGDYLLIPPGKPHHPIFNSYDTPYRRLILWISKSYLDTLCQKSKDFAYSFNYVSESENYHFRLDYISHQQIQGALLQLLEDTRGHHPFHEVHIQLLLCTFLILLNRMTYNMLHQVSPSHGNALYLNICDYINSHLGEDLGLDTLADFFFASKYHISHIFKDNMGISLYQYILKKRIHASKNSILSGMPLNQIYHQYGFKDYTSFYRAFKKEYGLSPKEFREQHKLPQDFKLT